MKDNSTIFGEAYDLYADAIYRHCFFRVYSKERAEELTQETFLKLWQYMNDGNEIENIRALAYRIATNLVIDDKRKHKEQSLDQLLEASHTFEPSVEGGKTMEREMLLKQVLQELESFPEEQRELVVMRYVDDMDPKDIAEVLGTTANNISVKLNRVVGKLKLKINLS